MPRITVRGLTVNQVCQMSEGLIDQLATICGCEPDNFTLECLNHTAIFAGKPVEAYPFIEVAWFERGSVIRNQVAKSITDHVVALGIPEVEVAFSTYAKEAYYINGISCE
ncbi:DUF1904 family protein [Paenibacillus sp. SYP-B3998]|uniref:DUF1904 family protein n=1 Tax=Paenibacillus sp. SYP-B3998 TaxID=2678564 RepID=A0A6G4A2G0_9BACL|nr:DUF1904 family protein [Paenibacillus sp. SYP-B3998]NEW07837.1 DUF1904 family protein [Paenibacillus sp. SYP-B3998]